MASLHQTVEGPPNLITGLRLRAMENGLDAAVQSLVMMLKGVLRWWEAIFLGHQRVKS